MQAQSDAEAYNLLGGVQGAAFRDAAHQLCVGDDPAAPVGTRRAAIHAAGVAGAIERLGHLADPQVADARDLQNLTATLGEEFAAASAAQTTMREVERVLTLAMGAGAADGGAGADTSAWCASLGEGVAMVLVRVAGQVVRTHVPAARLSSVRAALGEHLQACTAPPQRVVPVQAAGVGRRA